MPADLPLSPDDGIDGEFTRWMNEFAIRPEGFDEFDAMDLRRMADGFLEEDRKDEFVEDASDYVESMKSSGPSMDRLPVLHVSRENLTEVDNRSGIPEGFLEDVSAVTAHYIDGFIPGQDITPPSISRFDDDMDSDRAGSYSFRRDRSSLYASGGSVADGSPAATVSAHETMHKNNVEALIPDPGEVRSYALIYSDEAPQEFRDVVEESSTAPVNHGLLGGLGLLFLDEFYDANIFASVAGPVESDLDLEEYSDDFEYAVGLMEEAYNLEFFDVRDEAICQAVSFFMDGSFENGFGARAGSKREHYNSNDDYSHRAGDAVVNHLKGIKAQYEKAEGLRGQRFKEVMGKRIPFLRGEEDFNKY